jgi:hypothetical protein
VRVGEIAAAQKARGRAIASKEEKHFKKRAYTKALKFVGAFAPARKHQRPGRGGRAARGER